MAIHRSVAGLVISVFLALSPATGKAAPPSTYAASRPRVGLALSGGGARGAAHIGVLAVLEEHRVPIDYVAGTSMGAIVGGLYATGMTAAELDSLITSVDWDDALSDEIPRKDRTFRRKRDDDYYLVKHKPGISGFKLKFPPGVLDGWKVDLLLKRYTLPVVTVRDFHQLAHPYNAVAADLVTGEAVVLDHGDLALAMRASMSIPVVFAPTEIDGKLLVDGGISENLPIAVVRRMGADVTIAVDISSPLQEREQLGSVLDVTEQITTIMTRRNTDRQIASLDQNDIFIEPELGDIETASFDRAREAVPAGVSAAERQAGRLQGLSLTDEDYRALRAKRQRHPSPPVIDEVRIVNRSRIADGVIEAYITVKTGEPLDVDRLEGDLYRLYGLEVFELVYYDVTSESGRNVLTVTVRERSWGPNYLQFGVAILEDYESPNFNFAVAYTRTAVNRLNGEWRTNLQVGQEPLLLTEFYQPLDHHLRYFAHALASIGERAWNVFDADGNKLSELNVFGYGGELAVGRELGVWGQVRAGLIRASGEIEVQVGDPAVPEQDYDTGEAYAQFSVDELDDVSFPHSGGSLRVKATAGLDALGSDVDYEQLSLDGSYAYTRRTLTGLVGGAFNTTRDSDAPIQSRFRLGGFKRLSGFEQDEVIGQHSALVYGALYRRMGSSKLFPVYAGLSVEYGNVFEDRDDIQPDSGIFAGSVFLGVGTVLGPFYVAYGWAEGGRDNFYLFLGQPPRNFRLGFTR
jgi:NTE family protein